VDRRRIQWQTFNAELHMNQGHCNAAISNMT
jgi:hypothetical protein